MRRCVLTTLVLILASTYSGATNDEQLNRQKELFEQLDLNNPGLEAVKEAVVNGHYERAQKNLCRYYGQRTFPIWTIDPKSRPPKPLKKVDTHEADQILNRKFTLMGVTAQLPKNIDWDANPVEDVEWTVDLNQHDAWRLMGEAYWNTYNEKYAKDFVLQLRSWLKAYPQLYEDEKLPWRTTLRAAARMSGPWIDSFVFFFHSPHFTDDDKINMLHSIYQHAKYLAQSKSTGNWAISESKALFYVAVMLPEFKEAAEWRQKSIDRISSELSVQFYPDGAQKELTPHYHMVCVQNLMRIIGLAKLNKVVLPEDFLSRLEVIFDYCLRIAKPDLTLPMLNDSDFWNVTEHLQFAADAFNRLDMKYLVTQGKEGQAPNYKSTAFPYAGFYIMRSGWDRDARYLLFEAGPFGLSHQHEDKLQIDMYAYGRSLLMDPGRFTYVNNVWRQYFKSTYSHNTVLVDGNGQQREKTDKKLWVVDRPSENRWLSNDSFDYARGSYTDGYGSTSVVHTRSVLFVKDDYYVVSDRLQEAPSLQIHDFSAQFQFSASGATFTALSNGVQSQNDDANLMILPTNPEKFHVTIHEGEEDPPRGWIGWDYHKNLKTPASLVIYHWKEKCPTSADFILWPYPLKKSPTVVVKELPMHNNDISALQVDHENGFDIIVIQHNTLRVINVNGHKTKSDVLLLRYAKDGKLIKSVDVNEGRLK
jgi:Heparinase II/III N-terminus/Heparinase II/III-like protein